MQRNLPAGTAPGADEISAAYKKGSSALSLHDMSLIWGLPGPGVAPRDIPEATGAGARAAKLPLMGGGRDTEQWDLQVPSSPTPA